MKLMAENILTELVMVLTGIIHVIDGHTSDGDQEQNFTKQDLDLNPTFLPVNFLLKVEDGTVLLEEILLSQNNQWIDL